MSELEQQYGTYADFNIISPEETLASPDEIEEFGFVEMKHGLVIFDANGEAKVKMPGHQFGKEEIAAGLHQVLQSR